MLEADSHTVILVKFQIKEIKSVKVGGLGTIIALRIDDVNLHVCPHLPLILAFSTIENVLKIILNNRKQLYFFFAVLIDI